MAYRLSYRAFDDWRGIRWSIWGLSSCFGFRHLGGGQSIIITTALHVRIFALLCWRTCGILGAILAHGLMDFAGTLLLPNTDVVSLGRPNIAHLAWMVFGLGWA